MSTSSLEQMFADLPACKDHIDRYLTVYYYLGVNTLRYSENNSLEIFPACVGSP